MNGRPELLLRVGGEDVEPDLDLGAVGAGHVALGRGDPQGLPRARRLPTVGEVDGDGEGGAVALELDVFHGALSFVRVVGCGDVRCCR